MDSAKGLFYRVAGVYFKWSYRVQASVSRVTVPGPAEFSVKAPSFSGFVFMG
jgi:hypothetical protein